MAQKISVQVLGGQHQIIESVNTVAEIKQRLGLQNYTAAVNGNAVSDHAALPDYGFVTLSPSVKGGV